jgi:hypothetical protein
VVAGGMPFAPSDDALDNSGTDVGGKTDPVLRTSLDNELTRDNARPCLPRGISGPLPLTGGGGTTSLVSGVTTGVSDTGKKRPIGTAVNFGGDIAGAAGATVFPVVCCRVGIRVGKRPSARLSRLICARNRLTASL